MYMLMNVHWFNSLMETDLIWLCILNVLPSRQPYTIPLIALLISFKIIPFIFISREFRILGHIALHFLKFVCNDSHFIFDGANGLFVCRLNLAVDSISIEPGYCYC